MTENPKKRSASSQPKRSARKKFDVSIDPEVEAWSKKLFHPIKPIIEGLKEQAAQKAEADFMSDSAIKSASAKLSHTRDSDFMSDTVKKSESDIKVVSDKLADTFPFDHERNIVDWFVVDHDQHSEEDQFEISDQRSEPSLDQATSRSHRRSELEIKSDPDFSSDETLTGSERAKITDSEIKSDPDKITGRTTVALTRGELRIPNYVLKGLLPILSNSEFVVYLWLYFLSHGFNKTTCYVSAGKLAKSVNLTDRTVFRALNSLEGQGLIRRTDRHFLGKAGGLTFEVFLPSIDDSLESDTMSDSAKMSDSVTTSLRSDSDIKSTNKDHDHDLKRMTDHERRTKEIYHDLTANTWTSFDHQQYIQIKDLPIEKIESAMKVIISRAADPIRSFAYFAKSLKNVDKVLANAANPRLQRAKMQEMMRDIVHTQVGGKISVADLEEKVRLKCESLGIVFDKALFNDLVSNRQF